MRKLLPVLLALTTIMACKKDNATRLFEMNYLNLEYSIPPGQFFPQVSSRLMATNYVQFRDINNATEGEVVGIRPFYARMNSLDNLDFGFLEKVSIRVCPTTQSACTEFDEVFFRDDLFRRNQTQIRLDPGLRSVTDLLKSEAYRLEVVVFPGEITPYQLDFRLDFAFEAVK